MVNRTVGQHKTVVEICAGDGFVKKYYFHDDLESPNKVGKCRDEIEFCREFVNLGN
jgi:hypothetical protein